MEYHLVILVHGLWGNLTHFSYLKSQLEASYNEQHPDQSQESLVVYETGSNEGYKTYDGIDICGKRVAAEIEAEILRLDETGSVVKLSVVGYSLGGLMARYAIGILYYKNLFDRVQPVNFTTFCTPHVGVLTPGKGVSIQIFNWLVPFLLANTGRQIFLKDKAKVLNNTMSTTPNMSRTNSSSTLSSMRGEKIEQPLLALMSNPASIFYKSLKLFKYRALYGNVVNDKRTSWWTAGISAINPFEALDVNPNIKIDDDGVLNFHNGNKFQLSYVDKYEPIVLDSKKPLKILTEGSVEGMDPKVNPLLQNIPTAGGKGETILDREKTVTAEYAENFFRRKFKWLIVIFNIVIYAPLWVSWFIITNLIERSKSGYRVLKESDAGAFLELYELADDDLQDGNAANTKAHQRRPSLTRTISETYDNLETKFEQNLQDQTDELMESVWDAMMSKKIQNEEDFFWFNEQDDKSVAGEEDKSVEIFTTSIDDLASYEADDDNHINLPNTITPTADDDDDKTPLVQTTTSLHTILSNFKLKFNNNAQYEIIKNLNLLGWSKFPIYIQLTNATHAAAIVRAQNRNFVEGETVVRHFCNDVFKLL